MKSRIYVAEADEVEHGSSPVHLVVVAKTNKAAREKVKVWGRSAKWRETFIHYVRPVPMFKGVALAFDM